jgi:hypothetical protein
MPRRSAGQPAEPKRVGPERPADFERLPKRYKKYISELEQQLHALQAMADAEPVWLEAYALNVSKRHLPSEARVCFKLPSGEIEVRIDHRRNGEALEVSSNNGRLLLLPDISNQIGIKVGRHE